MIRPLPSAVIQQLRSLRGSGLALLLFALSGCSGSPFGEALSRSFSSGGSTTSPAGSSQAAPAAAAPAPAQQGGAGAPASPGAAGANNPTASNAAASAGDKAGKGSTPATSAAAASRTAASSSTKAAQPGAAGSTSPAGDSAAPPARPAPYRVTILLPQADAAAPAEVVTKALRAAGVPFEVETIERLGRTTTPQAPVSRPAPEPR